MATPRKFETKDKVRHRRTLVAGMVEGIRRDHLGGTRTDSQAWVPGPGWQVQVGPVRDELLIKFEDGTASWTDSQDVMLRGEGS